LSTVVEGTVVRKVVSGSSAVSAAYTSVNIPVETDIRFDQSW
jgi:hypothetical protein